MANIQAAGEADHPQDRCRRDGRKRLGMRAGLPAEAANIARGLLQAGEIPTDQDHVGAGVGDRERHLAA